MTEKIHVLTGEGCEKPDQASGSPCRPVFYLQVVVKIGSHE